VLVVIQGAEPGVIYRLPDNRVTTIGRSARNSVVVASPSVSRYHCELSYVNGRWELHDLNSRKGTIVNGDSVAESRVLNAGDIIRLTSTVFRFDMVDESLDRDEALLAIKEAEMDVRLSRQAGKGEWLDEVIARNRMDTKDLHDKVSRDDEPVRYPLAANLIFLGAVAGLVAIAMFAAVRFGRTHVPVAPPSQTAAQTAYAEALKSADAGNPLDAVQKLKQFEQKYPQSPEARQAALKRQDLQATVLDQELKQLPALEAKGDYAGALQVPARLAKLDLDPQAAQVLADQTEYVQRLARAGYKTMETSAQQCLDQGDKKGAIELYSRMRDSVGIPELSAAADAKVKELQSAG
jgi:predicted negative regulator of RcsB-dependent stress response